MLTAAPATQSLYYTSDAGDGLSSSPSPDFTMHSGSPRGFPRFHSPSTSSSDIPSEPGDDAYIIATDYVDAADGPYGTRPALHHSLSYSSGTPLGSYPALLEPAALAGLPSSAGHHPDAAPPAFDGLYRMVPAAPPAPQSSSSAAFVDMAMPPPHLFPPAGSFHPMEARIRSPVPYF